MSLCDTGVDKSTIDNLNLGKGQFGRKLEYSLMCSTGQAFDLAYRICYLPVEMKCLNQSVGLCIMAISGVDRYGQFCTTGGI